MPHTGTVMFHKETVPNAGLYPVGILYPTFSCSGQVTGGGGPPTPGLPEVIYPTPWLAGGWPPLCHSPAPDTGWIYKTNWVVGIAPHWYCYFTKRNTNKREALDFKIRSTGPFFSWFFRHFYHENEVIWKCILNSKKFSYIL